MMKNIISLNRVWLLTRAVWGQNWSRDWKVFLSMAVVLAFVEMWGMTGTYPLPFASIVVALYLAGTTYSLFANQQHAMFYSTLPVGVEEKFVVNTFFVHIYYVAAIILVGIIGHVLAFALASAIALFADAGAIGILWHDFDFGTDLFWRIMFLWAGQSVFMFSSIYFQRHPILKTLLFAGAFGFGIFILDIVLLHYLLPCNYMQIERVNDFDGDTCMLALLILTTLYFWVLTYLRLKETEV